MDDKEMSEFIENLKEKGISPTGRVTANIPEPKFEWVTRKDTRDRMDDKEMSEFVDELFARGGVYVWHPKKAKVIQGEVIKDQKEIEG